MDAITLVYPYYNNPQILSLHCGVWLTYARDLKGRVRVIVVDDGSQDAPAEPVLRKMNIGVDIQLYRVLEDIGWNCCGAKNLGMRHVETQWAIMADIDHVVPEATARFVLEAPLDKAKAYIFEREYADGRQVRPHADSMLLRRELFWEIGGYDEDYAFKMGGAHMHRAVDMATGGRRLLRGAKLILCQSILPDGKTPVSGELRDEGRVRRAETDRQKQTGKLPAKAVDHLRFAWERVL